MSSNDREHIAKESGQGLHNAETRRRSRQLAPGVIGICLVVILAATLVVIPGARAGSPHGATLKVPSQYPTIQSAINAAHSGDTIVVAPGTYIQQLTITKSLIITGSGSRMTTIQSPALLKPDVYGNPWTIEISNGATVSLSGFTLLQTLQCLPSVGPFPGYLTVYVAGGGIGVGGSANLTLRSSVLITSGAMEGASCGESAFSSYGTGVGFGLDYFGSLPPTSLLGFGTVSGVTISGFGFGGAGVGVGGEVDSPAGSHALISNDQITTSTFPNPHMIYNGGSAFKVWNAAVDVGDGGNSSSATIVGNTLTSASGTSSFTVAEWSGSSAYIADNSITSSGWGNAISLIGSATATITGNSIVTGTKPGAWGILVEFASATIAHNSITGLGSAELGVYLYYSSATVEFNSISDFECDYNSTLVAEGLCGPHAATQYAGQGIRDEADAGTGTTIANNFVFNTDDGIFLFQGCPGCVVTGNALVNNVNYGFAGIDGSYTFSQNLVVGGLYGVASIAYSEDTVVTASSNVMAGQSVGPFYYEVDFPGGTATIVGK
jgi:hypothetical protein